MRSLQQQVLTEIMDGECDECGVLGLVISRGRLKVCELCEKEME